MKGSERLTEVVFTPQSNGGVVGEGAGGVSTHSKLSSEVLLILRDAQQFCKIQSRRVGNWTLLTAVKPTLGGFKRVGAGVMTSPAGHGDDSSTHSTAHR